MIAFLAGLALMLPHPPNVAVSHGHVPTDYRIKVVRPWRTKLERMAWCESRRRWHLVSGNGFYGGVQFTIRTWYAAGGHGNPAAASKLEQEYRAVQWHNKIGTWVTTMGWPVCGYA